MKTSFKPCLPAIYSPETLVNVTHNITSLTNALTKSFIKILIIIRNVHVHNRQKKTSRQKTIHVSHPISFFSAQKCSGLRAPINGRVSKGFGQYKDLVTYSCNSNQYRLNGPIERECQANGQWSGREPTCERMYIA